MRLKRLLLIIFIMAIPFKVSAYSTNNYLLVNAFASSGGEITLSGDVTATSSLYVNAPFVLDLNGYTLDMGSYSTVVNFGSLTIKDSSSSGSGKVIYTGSSYMILNYADFTLESGTIDSSKYGLYSLADSGTTTINGGKITASKFGVINGKELIMNGGEIITPSSSLYNYTNSIFEMNGGKVETTGNSVAMNFYGDCSGVINNGEILALSNGGNAITQFHNTDVTINGGTIKANGTAVMGNGTEKYSNANLTVNGGTISSQVSAGIYAPQVESDIKITGGSITGKTGIEIRSGNLKVTGGIITGDTNIYEVTANTNGVTTMGSAISVSQHTTKQPINVYVCAGTFNGRVTFSQTNPLRNEQQYIDKITMLIDEPCGKLEFISNDPDKTVYSEDFNKFIKGGIYTTSVRDYLADGYTERDINGKKEVVKINNNINNPKTGDNIYYYLSIFALIFILIILRINKLYCVKNR